MFINNNNNIFIFNNTNIFIINNNNIFIINNNNKNTLMGLELQTVPLLGRTKKQKKRNKIVLFILRKKALVDLTKIIERFPPIL